MKNKILYISFFVIIFSVFYPLTKQIVFNNYIVNASKNYVESNMEKIPDINKSDFKAEIPIIILKKENYIEYLIESPKKNRDVNSYYVELSNNNGKLEYKLKYKEEG